MRTKWFTCYELVSLFVAAVLLCARVVALNHSARDGLMGRPLQVGIASWPGYAGGLVANMGLDFNRDCIFWNGGHSSRDAGDGKGLLVKFHLYDEPSAGFNQLLLGGDRGGLDVMWTTIDSWAYELPTLSRRGLKARAIMQVDWSRGGDAIVVAEDIHSVEQLKSQDVSFPDSGPSRWLLESALSLSGLDPADRENLRLRHFVPEQGPEIVLESFLSRKVQAAVLWEPFVSRAIDSPRRVAHKLLDSNTSATLIADILVARTDLIKDQPDVLKSFVRSWLGPGTDEAYSNPALAARLLRYGVPRYDFLTESLIREGLPYVSWTNLKDNAAMFGLTGNASVFDRLYTGSADLWTKEKYISFPVSVQDSRDDRFVRELYAEARQKDLPPDGCADALAKPELAVQFVAGGWTLSKDSELPAAVRKVSEIETKYSNAWYCVVGGIDLRREAKGMQDLSRKRAEELVTRLRGLGVPGDSLLARGYPKPADFDGVMPENLPTIVAIIEKKKGN